MRRPETRRTGTLADEAEVTQSFRKFVKALDAPSRPQEALPHAQQPVAEASRKSKEVVRSCTHMLVLP
jgi:hypothetical protein